MKYTKSNSSPIAIRVAVTGFRGIPAKYGGVEQQCEHVYTRLAAMGMDITVYARSHYVPESISTYKGVRIKRLPTVRKSGLEAFLHTFFAVLFILKDNPDIVHFYTQGPCLFSWLPRVFRPRMKVFFTCQGLDWKRKKWSLPAAMIIYLGEIGSAIFPHERIVVSKTLQDYYSRKYNLQPVLIPNGVEPPMPIGAEVLRAYGLKTKSYFLSVGRLVPEKRWEDIIEAFKKKPRSTRLVIVGGSAGTDDYVEKLKRLADRDSGVVFTGYLYGETLAAFFTHARAFVTASELEGLPLTLLEALSFGCVPVVSDIGPHREIVEKISAYRFPVGDVDALSMHMDILENLTHRERDSIGLAARKMVKRHFSWDRIADRIERLYECSLKAEL